MHAEQEYKPMINDTLPLIADPRVLKIPIIDNHELLIDLKNQSNIAYGPSPEIPNNQDYTKMRITVYNKLKEAQILLPPNLRFCLYEGYRSLVTQNLLFEKQYQQIRLAHPSWSQKQCFHETTKLVSPVVNQDGSVNVPPHSTGAAIDVYLIDSQGVIVDMGIEVKDWLCDIDGELSATHSSAISHTAQRYRKIMHTALSAVGFINYSTEYWHWSYGDRYWAFHKKMDHAYYGVLGEIEQALHVQLPASNSITSEQASHYSDQAYAKVMEARYQDAITMILAGLKEFPHDFNLQADLASLLGDYSEIMQQPLKDLMIKKSQELFEKLMQELDGHTKKTVHCFKNEYFYRYAHYCEQYELGIHCIADHWGNDETTKHKHGYYSQGVGAANYAKQLLQKGHSTLAHEYAQKAIIAWKNYFTYKHDYYNAYVHYALALGILGHTEDALQALQQSAMLINKDLTYHEFKEVIDFINNWIGTTDMNIEIELRYEVVDEAGLTNFLDKLTLLHTKRVVDIYLDTPDAKLIERGIYIRIRDNKKIDIKFNRECLTNTTLEIQPYCEEYSFALPMLGEQLQKFNEINTDLGLSTIQIPDFEQYKTSNHLIEHRIVDKTRTSYSANDFTIMVDRIKDLGTFLEIEVMARDTKTLGTITANMRTLLAPLHLKPLKTGYDSLILRKQNFAQYVRGRFALEEDKQWYRQQQDQSPFNSLTNCPNT